jgi:polyisoprenoid-binding protein YceI
MGISFVHGRFGHITGAVELNEADMSKSRVWVNIDVTGVDTGEPDRDKDLKSDNFFDVANFPSATFASTSVARSGSGLTIQGNLTVHGVTKPVTLQAVAPTGPLPGMDKKPHTGYSATATVSRQAFGIGPKYPAAILGDDIKLTIELDTVQQE